jgi:hypothetical protein
MNNKLFRISGIAAITCAILYIASVGISFAGGSSSMGQILYVASSLLFLVVVFVLYLELRSKAGLYVLVGAVLLAVMTIWSLFIDPTQPSAIFGPLTIAYGLGLILLGWAQLRSSMYPRTIGYLAIATGVIALAAGAAILVGASYDVFGLLNLVLSVPYLIWLVWLGWIQLKSQGTSPQLA